MLFLKIEFDRRDSFMDNVEQFELVRAEAKDAKYSNPSLRLFLALGYLGIFSSVIAVYMIIMSALSREDHGFNVQYTAVAIVVFIVCLTAVIVMNYLDKKARKEFFKKEKQLLKNAKKYKGKIVAAEKNIRHVKYVNEVFDEIIWNFVIKYKNENDEIITVKSEKFLNDISEVLKSRSVTVYVLEDGSNSFGGYHLREKADDEYIKLKIKVHEEEAKV